MLSYELHRLASLLDTSIIVSHASRTPALSPSFSFNAQNRCRSLSWYHTEILGIKRIRCTSWEGNCMEETVWFEPGIHTHGMEVCGFERMSVCVCVCTCESIHFYFIYVFSFGFFLHCPCIACNCITFVLVTNSWKDFQSKVSVLPLVINACVMNQLKRCDHNIVSDLYY